MNIIYDYKYMKPIFLGTHKQNNNDLSVNKYATNIVLPYDQTLDPIQISNDLNVSEKIHNMRRASECHKQVRHILQDKIQPGMSYVDIANLVESNICSRFPNNDLKSGIGFPTGISVNNIAAHDGANVDDKRILKSDDVCKIDFGTHVGGYIIDSAFTIAFNPKYESLLEAAKDGMWTGIKMAGPDANVNEVSRAIQEAIESYEIELDGKKYPIKSTSNLGGHTIDQYKIHAGKLVLGQPHKTNENTRMQSNECWAIEVFPTTGEDKMYTDDKLLCNHFMLNSALGKIPKFNFKITGAVYTFIKNTRSTLPFSSRWLFDKFGKQYIVGLNELIKKGIVATYPPLLGKEGTYNAQFEHTMYLHEYGKEIISNSDDY
ncbi:MAG: metallopeptidase family M24 [Edafosvirus sp.]|uniref:Metallopeptidase family M24 n=1 Tax=Edafosvirus sp. TaxID=2487765 RepID=A0A3G4ZXZ1_9VIRU|nr:MAG: metallopeptidase family M24 [Edafosvirus sp.]